MAGEASSLKAKVVMPGQGNRPGFRKQLTLQRITEWIRLQGLDEYTEEGLIEIASKYPTAALPSFRKNFNLMIQRVRQKRKQELGQVEQEIPDAESESKVRADPVEQPVDGEVTGDNDGSTIVYA